MLLFGLGILHSMQVQHVEAYGDSLLVVQQVAGEFQCLDGSLRSRLNACLDLIIKFAEFKIRHIPRHENQKANLLAQQASGYDVEKNNFHLQAKPMHKNFNFFCAGAAEPAQSTGIVSQAGQQCEGGQAGLNPAKPAANGQAGSRWPGWCHGGQVG